MQNSHDDGSSASLRILFAFVCMWEILYNVAKYALKIGMSQYPNQILDSSLLTDENKKNDARRTLLQRGPSYIVSLLHSVYATGRGILHLYNLWNASNVDKVLISGKAYQWAHGQVQTTNTLFLSYLLYDLLHILMQYPKLGGVDTILHHALFASCSVINGTYGIMPFAFGWLIVGEGSTIFLNVRWFLLKSGRESTPLLDNTNKRFAATFFLTRIGIYSAGIFDLFFLSWPELRSLPSKSGVPISLLGMTCGCLLLGWGLNILWGYKILGMVFGKANKKKQQ